MKKPIILFLVTMFAISLTSCKKEEIDLKDLPYYQYLNENNPVVTIEIKDYGKIKLQLFPEVAENTVNNFINYITDKSYDGSTFHRIIENFMIQGGQVEKTNSPIKGEFRSNGFANDLSHRRGVISMARTMFPNSATSQFFIVHEFSPHLDGEYAAFGAMISGFDVLDKIASVDTNFNDAPLKTIKIKSIKVTLNGYEPAAVIY